MVEILGEAPTGQPHLNTGSSLRLTYRRPLAIHRAPAKGQRLTFRRLHSSHPAPAMRTKA